MSEVIAVQHTPSIWESIKRIFNSSANAVTYAAQAVSTTAEAADQLAKAGLIMAESNTRLVKLETKGKEEAMIQQIQDRYPHLQKQLEEALEK